MTHKLYRNQEHVERTIMRPMAEEITEKLSLSKGCVDYYVKSVELNKDGKCHIDAVFVYEDDRKENESIILYYEQEII